MGRGVARGRGRREHGEGVLELLQNLIARMDVVERAQRRGSPDEGASDDQEEEQQREDNEER